MPKDPDKARNTRGHANRILSQDSFEEAFVALQNEEEELEQAKGNPKKWLKDKGVQLPGNPNVDIQSGGSGHIEFCWDNWCFRFSWP